MIGQKVQPRRVELPPAQFAETYVARGYRGIEKAFGASTPTLNRWIELCGGEQLKARHRAAREA